MPQRIRIDKAMLPNADPGGAWYRVEDDPACPGLAIFQHDDHVIQPNDVIVKFNLFEMLQQARGKKEEDQE